MKTASSKPEVVMVKIAGLKTNLFVREGLNEGHVLYLADLIDGGTELPPILITRDMEIVDGRQRKEAFELNKRTEIPATFVDVRDDIQLIAMAYQANVGGSLPPTQQDTEHTIQLLLRRGVPKKQIADLLGLPASMARKYVNDVQSKTARLQLQKAVTAVTEAGLTIAKAAETYGVDLDKLKEIISGRRRKHKAGVADIQRGLSSTHKSLSLKNAALVRSLLEKYEDGDVSEKQAREIFEHIEDLQKKASRTFADWRKRFEAKVVEVKETAKVA